LSFLCHTSLLSACHAILPSPSKQPLSLSLSLSWALRHRDNVRHLQSALPQSCHNKFMTVDVKSFFSILHAREYMTVDVKSCINVESFDRNNKYESTFKTNVFRNVSQVVSIRA
jgi:hypothetical protein